MWRKSSSSLKMTYCGILCERGDLGFTLEGLLQNSFGEVFSDVLPEKISSKPSPARIDSRTGVGV